MVRTRKDHLNWCKKRAFDYLDKGDCINAIASFMSDIRKHEETSDHPALMLLVIMMTKSDTVSVDEVRSCIDGFN